MCYAYFMLTRREFTWEAALERYVGRWEATELQRAGWDARHYARLKVEVQRLGELVQAAQQQEERQRLAEAQQQQEEPAQGVSAAEGKNDA